MSALVAVALLVRRSWSALAAWLVAVLGGEALNLLLKDLFARPRPHFEHPLVVEASYGFPSGQAMGSLFAILTWTGRGKRGVSVGGAAVLVILIGFARVYLGAHYLSDVVGGFVAGGAWLSAVIAGWEKIGGHGMASRRGQASSP